MVSPTPDEPVIDGMVVTVLFGKDITVRDGAGKAAHHVVTGYTVEEALQELSIPLNRHDRVRPSLSTVIEDHTSVTVTRIQVREWTKRERVEHKTLYRTSSRLYRGEAKTVKKGRDGVDRVFLTRKIVNGAAKRVHEDRTVHVRKPVTQVVVRGTKPRPVLTGVWRSLAQCESGLNPRIVSSNGMYHGLFQFSVSTWNSVGGSGLPSRASVAEQVKRAKILQARSGWGQWPHCSGQLGLG